MCNAGKLAVRRHLQEAWTSRRLLETNVTSNIAPSTAESSIVNSPTSSGATNSAASAALAAGQAGKAATIAADATGTIQNDTLCLPHCSQLYLQGQFAAPCHEAIPSDIVQAKDETLGPHLSTAWHAIFVT